MCNELQLPVCTQRCIGTASHCRLAGPSVTALPPDWAAATEAAQQTCMFTDRDALVSHCAHIAMHPSVRHRVKDYPSR